MPHVGQLRVLASLKPHSSVQLGRAGVVSANLGCISFQRRLYSDEPEQSVVRRLWVKFATTIKVFMNGTKLLYSDVKMLRDIQLSRGKRLTLSDRAPLDKSDFPFTRTEVQFIYTTNKDLRKMLPTIVLFFVPLLGYAIPFIAFLYPQKMLSSHFLSEEERQRLRMAGVASSAEQVELLAGYLGRHEQKNFFADILKQGPSSLKWEDLHRKFSSIPDTSFQFDALSKKHMSQLGHQWGTVSWLTFWPSVSRLQRHMSYLFVCDWLIQEEGGVEKLSDQEVMQACLERRLWTSVDNDIETLKQKLSSWLSLTTYFRVCPVSLVAHLPLILHKSQL